ncbi:hypothetical protein Droror1_Dr00018071 [Drosera rotundifolia]
MVSRATQVENNSKEINEHKGGRKQYDIIYPMGYTQNHLVEQAEIKTLTSELQELMVEPEESRRKFIYMRLKKSAAFDVHSM